MVQMLTRFQTEATGMARAMSDTGIPYIISFTIQKDGKLIDGHTIDYAIRFIDDNVSRKPVCYMTNCVHPCIVYEALAHNFNQTEVVRTRFIGIQANIVNWPVPLICNLLLLPTWLKV